MKADQINIHLVTSTTGFPNGTAAACRIRMVGKAVIESGSSFSVYTNTVKDNPFNKKTSGTIDRIDYKYLHGKTQLNIDRISKTVLYCKGIIALNNTVRKLDPKTAIVYIYSQGDIFNVITLILCRLYRIKTVEEINEWDYDEMKGLLRKMIFRGPMVKWADAAIVISKNIKENITKINPKLKTLTIPVLEDPELYNSSTNAKPGEKKYCFWMGLVDGYIDDVLFIVESCGLAFNNGCDIDLVIAGPCRDSLEIIKNKAASVNYPEQKITISGYLSEESLNELCLNAMFYIVPLWHNQKSVNRFPTKIAPFMFSGKPVITAKIGEVGILLTDMENVLYYEAGSSADLAARISLIYRDKELYDKISRNAKAFALNTFNYRRYVYPLQNFFTSLLPVKEIGYHKNFPSSHAEL